MAANRQNDRLYIIPDVHGRDFWRKTVAENPEGDFIFLGDYIDPYPDEGISEEESFMGFKDIIRLKEEHPDRVTLLWGNHDLHYLYPELMGHTTSGTIRPFSRWHMRLRQEGSGSCSPTLV